MTQEEKELLLKDLCARLPYGIIVKNNLHNMDLQIEWLNPVNGIITGCNVSAPVEEVRPYLRPMSSMTEEEIGNLEKYLGKKYDFRFTETESFIYIDWLNAHHFDYRGLIEKGLAIEVTKENNPYERF